MTGGDDVVDDRVRRNRIAVLWLLWVITACLSVAAFVPTIVYVATFLAVIPAVILACAPTLLLIDTALLVYVLFGSNGGRKQAWTLLAACVLVSAAFSYLVNQPAARIRSALSRADHDSLDKTGKPRNFAIQTVMRHGVHAARLLPDSPLPPAKPEQRPAERACESLCLHLLFNGVADSVIVSAVKAYGFDPPPDGTQRATRFRIERREKCPPSYEQTRLAAHRAEHEPSAFPVLAADDAATDAHVLSRIAAGECLIDEPATVYDADILIQEEVFEIVASELPLSPRWPIAESHCYPQIQSARRVSIYELRAGGLQERFRRTEVDAEMLLPILVTRPQVGAVQNWPYATVRCLRWHRLSSPFDLRQVLKAKLGLEVLPVT